MSKVVRDADLLVLAPLFPSISQAWMDRYLEQMLDAGWRPCVLSTREDQSHSHARLRKLGLLERTRVISDRRAVRLQAALQYAASHPRMAARIIRRIWESDSTCGRKADSNRCQVSVVVQSLQYAAAVSELTDLRVCHAHSPDMAYPLLPVLADSGIPLVLTFHGLKPRGVPQLAPARMREVLLCAAVVLANTSNSVQQLTSLGCPRSKIRIIPQGIPLKDFPFVPAAPPIGSEPVRFVSIGRLHAEKGYGYAALALRRLVDHGQRIRWDIVGAGPHEVRIRRLVVRLGLAHFTTFHGTMASTDVSALYRRSHIMILASLSARSAFEHVETQGVVIQEAQASGCLVVASAVGGIPECVYDNLDGYLVEERSHRALARKLMDVIHHPERWKAVRDSGRRRVMESYAAESIGRRTDAILREVAAAAASGGHLAA